MGVNKVIIVGNVGKDPEIKDISGTKLARFSLATSETYKDRSGEKKTSTEWHNIVIWGKLADVVEKYVKKGSQLYLEGKIVTKSYEKDGQTRYMTEINCHTLQMLDSKKSEQKESESSNDSPPF